MLLVYPQVSGAHDRAKEDWMSDSLGSSCMPPWVAQWKTYNMRHKVLLPKWNQRVHTLFLDRSRSRMYEGQNNFEWCLHFPEQNLAAFIHITNSIGMRGNVLKTKKQNTRVTHTILCIANTEQGTHCTKYLFYPPQNPQGKTHCCPSDGRERAHWSECFSPLCHPATSHQLKSLWSPLPLQPYDQRR